jgi:coproporphyrinogen III oxidase-like Fe-S oxidoreductase
VGLGAGAVGALPQGDPGDHALRWRNEHDVPAYLDALERGDAGRVRMIESALTAKMRAFNERVRSAQGSNNYPG